MSCFHRKLLKDLATEGSNRCCYMPGAGNPALWPTSRCDCKYIVFTAQALPLSSEQTGCCEIRAAYEVVKQDVDDCVQCSMDTSFENWKAVAENEYRRGFLAAQLGNPKQHTSVPYLRGYEDGSK